MSDDLRRVLKDPAHRLPDSLVDLDAVHAGARRVQRRRAGLAAVGGVVAVVAISLAVVQPWSGADESLPIASTGPTPSGVVSPTPHSTPPVSPSPTPDRSAGVAALDHVVGVSAVSDTSWWVLGTTGTCPGSCETQLLRTQDGGRTFVAVSSSRLPAGIPAGTTTVRFMPGSLVAGGFALVPSNPVGKQLFATFDGGSTWQATKSTPRALALEAGGGTAWLLVQEGARIGALALAGRGYAFIAAGPDWVGAGNGVAPALTVQGGNAVVLWYTDAASHLSVVSANGTVDDRVNPCTRDLGSGSVSATADGMAVSCHTGTLDTAYGSADGGRSWGIAPTGAGGRLVVGSINAGLMAVGGQDGRLTLATSDSSQPIVTRGADGTGAWTWIGFTSQTSGFAIDEAGQLFHTDQRGTSWAKVTFRP